MPSPPERIALFIDGAYLIAAAKALGFEVDFKRLLEKFRTRGTLVRANYYTAYEDQVYAPRRPLLDWLAYNGYSVFEKEVRSYVDSYGIKKKLPRIELEIAIDAMVLSSQIDHMVLVAASADFRRLVDAIQRRGVHVTVVSTLHAPALIVADALRRQADTFVELWDLRLVLERQSIDEARRLSRRTGKIIQNKEQRR